MIAGWFVYAIFFVSGISGLVYEVIWTRQFGNLFGNTIYSAAIVTSVFMGGLGFGSFFAGRWCDRPENRRAHRQLFAYGVLELAIAALALIVSAVLPRLHVISGSISSYVPAHISDVANAFELSAGSHAIRFVLAVILIAPITFLMGATLPILIRAVVRERLDRVGWYVGLLYGINTAGAAIGAFSVDVAFIPEFGITNTQYIAAALNIIAGLAAVTLGRRQEQTDHSGNATLNESNTSIAPRVLYGVGGGMLVAGFVAMALQMVWFRFLTGVLESTRSVFSLLLTVILGGLVIGTFIGGRLRNKPLALFLFAQALLPIATLGFLYFYDTSMLDVRKFREIHSANADTYLGIWIERWFLIRPIAWLVGVPAIIAGLSYPLANSYVQRTSHELGTNAGFLYLFNTVGAICGSLITGFFFLPNFGVQQTLAAITLISLLGIILLYFSSENRDTMGKSGRALAAFAVCALLVVFKLWSDLPTDYLLRSVYRADNAYGGEYIARVEGLTEYVAVTEKPPSKDSNVVPDRALLTNGIMMSWTDAIAQRYMRGFTHVPLLQITAPENVLVICFGVGNTVNSASLHPSIRRIDVADLSKTVLEMAPKFSHWNQDVLKDPRTHVYVNDGRQHLRMTAESTYDLITLEPPPMGSAGVNSLYSTEFYRLAKSRLKQGGYVTQWLPLGQAPDSVARAMVRAFTDVFPNMVLLSASGAHLIMMGKNGSDSNTVDIAKVQAAIKSRPLVEADLKHIKMATPTEFVGMFVNVGPNLDQAFAAIEPLHDDRPQMEHWRTAFRKITKMPDDMHSPKDVTKWCPSCFDAESPTKEFTLLPDYLALVHQSIFGAPLGDARTPEDIVRGQGSRSEALRQSQFLRAFWNLK